MNNLDILYEDNHLIIINKKPSDIVQGDKTNDTPLSEHVKAYIKAKYNKPGDVFLGVIHRLDRPASGAVIFARTSKALIRMNELFKEKNITKTYWAVVKQRPSPLMDKLVHYMSKNEQQNKSYVCGPNKKGALMAELQYRVIQTSDNYHLLEIDLKTGRHHQIRVQLSDIGSPIKGDVKYGSDRPNKDGSIHLHARKIEFIHPVTKENILIEARPPKDPVWDFFINNQ